MMWHWILSNKFAVVCTRVVCSLEAWGLGYWVQRDSVGEAQKQVGLQGQPLSHCIGIASLASPCLFFMLEVL